jgi:hypothetical protein
VKRGLAAALTLATAVGIDVRAAAQAPHETAGAGEYTFQGNLLRIGQSDSSPVVDLQCEGRSALQAGSKLLVACGPAGVVQVDVSDPRAPRREGVSKVNGDATGLFLRDGRVWVEIARVDAKPVSIESRMRVSATPVSLRAPVPEAVPTPAPSTSPENPKERPSVVAPPRQGNVWEISLLGGAFVTLGTLAAGVLGSTSVVYRAGAPFVLRAELAPVGIAGPAGNAPPNTSPISDGVTTVTHSGTVSVAAAQLLAGLDTQFIEVALGIGGATVNQNVGTNQAGRPDASALSIAEYARIGARDGLALNMESSAIAANGQFNLGYLTMRLQIPLSRTSMLVARGGGGPVGFASGDLGVRVLVQGDGGRGTVALTGYVGGALIMVDLCSSNPNPPSTTVCNDSNLGGPSLGGGVEWKL